MSKLEPVDFKSLEKTLENILGEFNPKKLIFIDAEGRWKENPVLSPECVSHELLFYLWNLDKKELPTFIQKVLFVINDSQLWSWVKKTRWALLKDSPLQLKSLTENEAERDIVQFYSSKNLPKDRYSFLIVFEVIVWSVVFEAYRINSQLYVPYWDRETQSLCQEYKNRFQSLNDMFNRISGAEHEGSGVVSFLEHLTGLFPGIMNSIPPLIAEEGLLSHSIDRLLSKAKDPDKCEEIFSLVIQKIQPSQGIVTQTSPALLMPCLRLLLENSIDISSGIQYHASVILSVLKDTRSTEILIKALHSYPFHMTKIRENILYTLGLLEEDAVEAIAQVLEEPDQLMQSSGRKEGIICSLRGQKEEAILALGKIGLGSLRSLPALLKYMLHPSARLKACLAWALGEIGKAQKEKFGGVSADIIIALLSLLRVKDKENFEEAVCALKKIGLPEFLHALHLYDIGAVSILGLKPAQKGLYELSETLHDLIKSRGRAIVAVNGDSGTGKTYFCQAISQGFGDVKAQEILYLMRDRKKDHKIFNRILGIAWLKKYIDPVYCQDYPLLEEEDDPDDFMETFLEENKDKKLIILDGCRDQHYFHRVVELLYFKGVLDVAVTFRATFSSRRLNLEGRERALESINSHLSFLEEPVLEDTLFYREGIVILYDLDNSASCRLDSQEIQELFKKRRIEAWGNLIHIGGFDKELKAQRTFPGKLTFRTDDFSPVEHPMPKSLSTSFVPEERIFKVELNDHLSERPNLLGKIETNDIKPVQLCFYAQDQLAGMGEDDSVFVLTFLDSRIFHTKVQDCKQIVLHGRDFFLLNTQGGLSSISFEGKEMIHFGTIGSPIIALATFAAKKPVTGHEDGSIGIWDLANNKIVILRGHQEPVCSLVVDYSGHIYSASLDHTVKLWDLINKTVRTVEYPDETVSRLNRYPDGKILALAEGMADKSSSESSGNASRVIKIMDIKNRSAQIIPVTFGHSISSINVNFDGRIVISFAIPKEQNKQKEKMLAILSPEKTRCKIDVLEDQIGGTTSSLVMRPKIITCGKDEEDIYSLHLWGNKYYVKHEHGKMSMQPK
jgi:WD40 repeat protein